MIRTFLNWKNKPCNLKKLGMQFAISGIASRSSVYREPFRSEKASVLIRLLSARSRQEAIAFRLLQVPLPSGPYLYAVALVLIVGAGLMALLHSFLLPIQLVLKGKGVGFEQPQGPNSVMKNAGSEKSGEN